MSKPSKLTHTDVSEMKRLFKAKKNYKQIAERFEISIPYAFMLINDKKYLKRPAPKQLELNFSFPSKNH